LKYLFLKDRGIHTPKGLSEYDSTGIKTHNLNSLLRKVRMRKQLSKFRRTGTHKKDISKDISSEELHVLYRYGGQLDSECEEDLMESLSSIIYEIESNL